MSKKKTDYRKAGLVFEELEPRLLLSADPLAVATDASVAIVQELVPGENEDHTAIVQSSGEQAFSSVRNELVIIDSRAPNYQQLHNDLIKAQQEGRNIHVVVLDAHRDGIEQINEALESHNKLDAIHIVSHGDDGQLQLGATQLNKSTLQERKAEISGWKDSFTDGGDLLIYGCKLAETADGKSLVDSLSQLTATDVAASDDLTGNKLLGGDWELEYEAGDIETQVAFSDDVQQNWKGTLEGAAPAAQQEQPVEEQQQEAQAEAELLVQQTTRTQEDQETTRKEDHEQQDVIIQEQRQEIVFVDESVDDYQSFIDDLQKNSDGTTTLEVYLLDGRSDGVNYINDVLSEYENVDAVHIFSHGDDAAVKLGTTWLNPDNLENYSNSLSAWSDALDANADILIYGCNLAQSEKGEQFTSDLAQLTGADVAASDDLTGHSSLGADWELEHSTGSIESRLTISDELKNSWEHVMTVSVDASSSGSTADQASVTVSHTTSGTNRLMMVGVSMEPGGDSVSSITYNGVNLTLVGTEQDSSGKARVEIWQMVAPDTGTHDVIVNLTGTSHKGVAVGVMTFTGVNQAAPTLTFASGSGNSTAASTTVASALDDLVFGVVQSHKGTAVTPGAGQTEYWDIDVNNANGSGTTETGATSVTTSWTVTVGEWAVAAVSIQADTNSATSTALTSIQDTYIQLSNPTTNAGTSGAMVIDRETGDLQRALVQFDLGSIPPGSTIQSATLKLEATSVAGLLNVEAYQLLESWAEGSVTWNESSSGTNWSTAGGAYNATALDSIATDTAGQHSFDISTLAQEWLDGTSQNYGVLIGSPDGGGNRTITYDSREGAAVPVLEIVYTANTAPVNAVPVAQSTDEDTSLTFDTANGNLISITAGAGEVLTTTISVTQGSLNLSQTTGLTFDAGANGTATMTVTGTVEDINAALDGLQYMPSTDYNGADTLTLTSSNAEIYSLEIDSNLLGRYEFSAASPGDDSSPLGANTATLVGNATIVTDGTRGDVVSLDGTAHAEIPGFFGEPVDATLAAWVNLTSYDSNGADIISLGDNLILRYEDWNHSLNGIYYDGTSWSQVNFLTGINLAGDGWHHVAYSVDDTNNTHAIYFDGVEVASSAMTGSVAYTNGTSSYIGAHGELSPQWDLIGLVDDARIYDRALTAAEIATLANAPVQASDSDSVAITVTPVNDAPTGSVTIGGTAAEHQTLTASNTLADADGMGSVSYQWLRDGAVISGATGTAYILDDADVDAQISVRATYTDGGGTVENVTSAQTAVVTGVNDAPEDLVLTRNSIGGISINENGGNDAYLLADSGIATPLTQFTFEMQFEANNTASEVVFVSYNTASGDRMAIQTRANNTLELDFGGTAVYSSAIDYNATLADGQRHTLSVTWNNAVGDWGVYIDGSLVDSGTGLSSGGAIEAGGTLMFGLEQDTLGGGFESQEYFSGTIYDVRLFDDIRTPTEIDTYKDATVPYDHEGLIANWQFNTLSTGGVVTEAVSGNNLTLQHHVGAGFSSGNADVQLSVDENAADGTSVGTVYGIDDERELLITTLLTADPDLVYNAETGKFYKIINANVDWTTASNGAISQQLNSVAGQLGTIRSAAENQAIADLVNSFGADVWLGASDAIAEGEFQWYSAGAPGDTFWSGGVTGSVANGAFANFQSGEPSDSSADRDYVDFDSGTLKWQAEIPATLQSYLVEWNADDVLDATDALTYSIVSQTVAGAFAIDADTGEITVADGSLLDFETNSAHSITLRVTDGGSLTYDEAFTISINDVNENPVAIGESYTAVEGIPFTSELGLNDLLLNDSDIDGDTLSVNTTPVSGPANGELILNADGTFTYTPNDNFNGIDTFTYEVIDGNGGSAQATATITVLQREIRILLTTQSDVNSSKVPGIVSWDSGEILGIGDPNLSFEPVGSDGSLLAYFDLEAFSASNNMTINGLHLVSNTITVGSANSVTLQRGDVLFVSENNEDMTSTNNLAINAGDVIVFRPDVVDDYSSGTFIHLLDQPGAAKTTGVTLVEKNVLVGDVTLQAGTFLFTQENVAEEGSIYHFSAADVGAGTTTGVVSTLISSVDIGVSFNNFLGVMLVTEDLYLDGTMVPAGSIVTTLENGTDFVGNNNIFADEDEIIYLTVTTTTMGSGTTSADATVLFDAGDIGLNNNQKKIRSFTIIEEISAAPNVDPVITLTAGSISYTENDPPTVIDPGAVLTDPDSADFDGGLLRVDFGTSGSGSDKLAIRDQGTAAGQIGVSGSDVTYGGTVIGTYAGGNNGNDPLTVIFNVNADVTAIQALIRNITYENTSNNPQENQRTINFSITDGDGGVSNTVIKNVVVNNVNFAPVLSGANDLNPIDEDLFNNGGTLVSILTSGWITDADAGSIEGIAVVGVDNTNGSWEFSIDGGTNWTAFGTPSTNAARLLAADANTFVRFVPDPDWNGTVTNGITFHGWDQTSGMNGDSVNISASGNVRDQFDSASYSNSDGTALWTSDWTEVNDSGSPNNGNIQIQSGKLHLDSQGGGSGEAIARSFDIAGATTAVLTFDYDGYGAGGLDTVAFEISSDGGSTWTLLENMDVTGNVSGSKSFNLESYTTLTADMQVRFRIAQGFSGGSEGINFDNVDISYSGTGIGGSSSVSTATASSSITVNPVNDVPVMDLDADDSSGSTGLDFQTNFVELNGAVSIVDSDVSLIDIDSANLASITVTLTNELESGNKETLAANPGATGLSVNWDSGTDVLTITGAGTVADYLSVLSTVTYNNTANNPDTTPRVITFVANDGTSDSLVATTTVTVTQTVKPPVNTVPGPQTVVEDTPTAIAGIDVRDNDNNLSTVALSVNNGTLNVTLQGGVTISAGANGSNSLTLSGGTEAEINNTLATLVYQSDLNYTGADTLTVLSTDALANIDTDTVAITVTPVNDAPLATDDPGSYSAGILALNPLGYWRFGETGGTTAADAGTTGVDATYNGVILGQAGAVAGDADTAAGFDGTDDYIEIAHNPAYLVDSGTVQLWFNTADVSQRADLFSKDASGFVTGGHLSVYLDGTGNIEARLQSDSTSYFLNSTLPLVNSQWHHVAVTFGTDGMQLYVDGQLQDSDAYSGGLGATSGDIGNHEPIVIGASTQISGTGVVTPLQDYFSGSIDEVALFGTALTTDEIQDIYASALQNYTVAEDGALNVTASEGVLINDSDIEGDALTAVLVSGPSNAAAFNLNADGSFSYTPTADFSGTDSFTYMANDGTDDSNVATVTITVAGVNDAPFNTTPVSVTVLEDTQSAVAGLSVADVDAGAGIITTQLTVNNGVLDVTLSGAATISAGANGSNTLTISGNVTDINATLASLQYTGNLNLSGTAADTLTMVTNDLGNSGTGGALSDTSNVQIDITAVNDAPVARDDRIGLVFDGVDDYVSIGDYAGLNVTTSMTMEAWIRPTGAGTGTQMIVNKEGEYEMGINATTGEVMWAFDNTNPDWNWHYTGYSVQPDEWTHLAVTYDNGVVNTYANGVLVDSYAGSGTIADNYPTMNELQIGGRENAVTQRFDGQIDEVRIWNTTRTQLDIQNNMNTLLTGAEAGLVGNWRFDEGSGTTVTDQSSFGHHGTLADGVPAGEMPSWQGYVVDEDGTLIVNAANGVLPNDYDIEGDPLTAVLVSGPANASAFTLNADGSFSYTPNANFNGIDSFTYMANDGSDDSNVATVTIRVNPVNDLPVATDNTVTTNEDTAFSFAATDFTFTDVEGDSLVSATITNLSLSGGTLIHSGGTAVTSGDTLTAAQLDTLVYTPIANTTGSPLATFDFSVNDAGAGVTTAQMDINVTAVNDVPVATANTVTTTEDNAYSFAATDFTFTDTEGDSLVSAIITNISLGGGALTHSGGTAVSSGDTLTAAQLDTLIYTPATNANGSPLATFDFSVNDAGAGVTTAQMDIDVTAVNDVPVATANTVTTSEDNAYSFAATDFTFTDTEGDSLVSATITNLSLAGGALTHSGGTAVTSGDTLTAAQLDTLIYTPAANANGSPLATFDFTVNDAGAGAVSAQMDIDVTAVNDVPVATANTVTTTEDNAYTFTAADFTFSDVEGDSLVSATITNLSLAGGTLIHSGGTTVSSGDTLTAAQLDTLIYTPVANANGSPLATFDFTVNDAGAGAVSSQMEIDVTAVNDVPVATVNTVSTTEDNAYTFTAADFTFSDVEGDSLVSATITNLSLAGGTLTHSGGTAVTSGDTLTAAQLDTLVYTPTANTIGSPLATFDFSVNDAGAGVVTAQMDIDVTAVNDVPVATANTVTTTEDNAYTFTAADFTFSDVEGDSLVSATITNLSLAGGTLTHSGGTAVTSGDTLTAAQLDTLIYTPTPNANGSPLATFDFTVNDTGAGAISAQMDIDVTAVNDVPVATVNTVSTTEDNAYTFTAADFTFSDVEGDSLVSATITNLSLAGGTLTHSGGTAVTSGDTLTAAQLDTLVYTPTANANGSPLATFDFTVNDAGAGVVTAQMDIDVTAVNDVPVATANTVTTTEDNAYTFTAADFTFSDVEGDSMVSATITNLSLAGGTLTHSGGTAVTSGDTLTAAQLDTLVYTPAANANGSPLATFDFTVNDTGAGAVSAQMDIDVTAVNDVPVATANTVTTTEDNAYSFAATDFTFSDVEGDSLVAARITNLTLAGGTLTYGGGAAVNDGDTLTAAQLDTLIYIPVSNTNGSPLATFDFTVSDSGAGIITAQMSINVTAVNDVPVATANTVTTAEDNAYSFAATDFTFTDTEGDSLVSATITNLSLAGGTLTHSGGTAVTSGDTLTAAQLDTLIYTPTPNANGSPLATFDFTVNDTGAGAISAQMDIDVTAVNDVPVATVNTVSTTEDNAYTFTAADFTFSDVEGDSLVSATITNLSLAGGTLTHSGGTAVTSGDTLTAAQLDTLVYTPTANTTGSPLATFDFSVNDAGAGVTTAQMDIDVTAVNDVPVATANTVTTTEDNAYSFAATDFTFSDVEGDSLVSATITNLSLAGGTLTHSGGTAVTSGDTLTAAQLDTLVYTPAANANGSPLATFDFTVNDTGAGAISAQMDIDVTAVNDVPVATANTVTTSEDNAYNFSAADFTFTDTEGDSLVSATITNLSLAGGTLTHSGGTAVTSGDTLTSAQLDTLVYTPAVNANGTPLASFDFSVNDSDAGATAAQMSINVSAQPDAAVIGGVDAGVVTEDVDPDLDNLLEVSGSLTIVDPDAGEAVFNAGVFGGVYGVITLNAAGDWDYAANTNQAAIQALTTGQTLTDTITISSADGTTHDIVITIMGTNDAPVAGNDVASVNEGGMVVIDVASTDSDIDNALDLNSIIITGLPVNGTVVVNGDGTVTYTHDGSETLSDSFTYTISDISGAVSNSATVTLTVNPVNDAPIAADDVTTVAEGNAVLIDLAANDSDADNALDLNSITIIGAPANGLLAVNGDGTVTYNHDGSETSSDSFTYTISDISGAISNTATVNITVTPVNDAPTTSGIADVTVNEDAAASMIDLHAAFNDADNLDSELTYSIVGNTNIGLFSLAGINGTTGQLSLGYAADMSGAAQISIRAIDPSGLSVDTLFTVTVTAVNDAPVMQANNGMVATGAVPGTITSSDLNVTDVDNLNSEIMYTLTVLPGNGQLLLNGVAMAVNDTFTQADLDNNRVVYHAAGTAQADQFGFTVTDGAGGTIANNTFDIVVQLAQDDDDTITEFIVPPSEPDEEPTQQIIEETGSAADGADRYAGGYETFGSTSISKPQPLPVLAIEPTAEHRQKPAQPVVKEVTEVKTSEVKTFSAVQLKSMDALWSAIDKMKQEMGGSSEDKMSPTEFRVAAAKSSGIVLTAGVVAWILRSGALLSSLMSTIPLWKGYDPLPILAYKDDDEEKEDEIHEDKIPTSLEELQKLKKLKEKKAKEIDVDSIFGGSAIRE